MPTGRWFASWLAVMVGLEAASWLSYRTESSWFVGAIIAVVVILGWRRPAMVAYASLAEAMLGGKGYLLQITLGHTEISLRMVLFTVTLLMAARYLPSQWAALRLKFRQRPLVLFITWLLVAVGLGLLNQHQPERVYTDANAFLFLGLLPAWWVLLRQDEQWMARTIGIAFAAVTVVGLKTWVVMVLFGENIHRLRDLYVWIRTTGIGEVTYINHNAYRVFFQSHIMSLLVFLWLIAARVTGQWRQWWWGPFVVAGLGVYLSLSRSLWLGGTVAMITLVVWFIVSRRWRQLLQLWVVLPTAVVAWAMMVWALSWPGFSVTTTNPAGARFQAGDAINAATARQNQFQPLLTAISRHPVLGSGFGQTVTYYSTDPAYQGWRTTAAFELGYLDLWLKMGITGLALFGWWVLRTWRQVRQRRFAVSWTLSLVGLLTVHVTTPYLNHPLGLTWLMLLWLVAYAE